MDKIVKLMKKVVENNGDANKCNCGGTPCYKCPLDVGKMCLNDSNFKHNAEVAKKYIAEHKSENTTKKTFKEVIKDIKEGETWLNCDKNCNIKEISCNDENIEIVFKKRVAFCKFTDSENFELQKQYTFDEAFKAYKEGKKIKSCLYNTYQLHYINSMVNGLYFNNEFKLIGSIGFLTEEIEGKWFIND